MDIIESQMMSAINFVKEAGGAGFFIGSYAYNKTFSGYASFTPLEEPKRMPNIDALCIMPQTEKIFRSFEEKMKWYETETNKLADELIKNLNAQKIVKASKRYSTHDKNIYLFPGTLIEMKYKKFRGVISLEANCNIDCDMLNATYIKNNIPHWVLLLNVQHYAQHAGDKHSDRYKAMFDLLQAESIRNDKLQVIENLLVGSEQIFQNSTIEEYRFSGRNIFAEVLTHFNSTVTAYEDGKRIVQGEMNSYMEFIKDKIIDKSSITHNGKTFNLRSLINYTILLINNFKEIAQYAEIVKSGGEVYRYLGHMRDTKDMDTKVFFKKKVTDANKFQVYQTIVRILIVITFILHKSDIVNKYIESFGDHKVVTKIFNTTINLYLTDLADDNPRATNVRLRHIKIGKTDKTNIKLLSIDMKIGMTVHIPGRVLSNGAAAEFNVHQTSSPLDVAFDHHVFDEKNILYTRQNMRILSPHYLIKDLHELLKNPKRLDKRIKDQVRLHFIEDKIKEPPSDYIVQEEATRLDIGHNLFLFSTQQDIQSLYDDKENIFAKHEENFLNAMVHESARYKTPFVGDLAVVHEIAKFDSSKSTSRTSIPIPRVTRYAAKRDRSASHSTTLKSRNSQKSKKTKLKSTKKSKATSSISI